MTLRVGFIGAGQISGAHLNGLKQLNEHTAPSRLFDLSAIADMRPEAAGRLAGAAESQLGRKPEVYSDYRQMIETEKLDAACALVPHNVHWSVARDCLDAGLHLQMQKPIAITIADGKQIINYAAQKNRALVVSEPSVLGRGTRATIDAINARIVGEPQMLLDYAVTTLGGGFFMGTPWRHLKGMAGAGWFLDHGVHRTHWFLDALGSVEDAFGMANTFEPIRRDDRHGEFNIDTEDCSMTVLRFRSGALGHWMVASAGQGEGFGAVRLYGSKGVLNFSGGSARLNGEESKPLSDLFAPYQNSELPHDAFAHSFLEFHQLITDKKPPISSGARALEALAIVYSCLEASETGRPVRIEDVISGKAHTFEDTIEVARTAWPETGDVAERTS